MNINYLYKTFSDESLFTCTKNRIELKEYIDNLVFYQPCNTEVAEFAYVDKSSESGAATLKDHGKFAACIEVKDDIRYNHKNFDTLINKGTLSLYLGVNKMNGYGSHAFSSEGFPEEGIVAGNYSFTLKVGSNAARPVNIELTEEKNTFMDILNNVLVEIDPNLYNAEVSTDDLTEIKINSTYQGDLVTISSGTNGTDLCTILPLKDRYFPCYPSEDVEIVSIDNGTDNSKIVLKHLNVDNSSVLAVDFYDNDGNLKTELSTLWNNDGINLDNIEIDFDYDIAYLFLNGELKSFAATGFQRVENNCAMTLKGTENTYYTFDEIILMSEVQHTASFTPRTTALTKYSITRPYVDFHFPGQYILQDAIDDLVVTCSTNIHAVIYYRDIAYYYLSGSWRESDGTFLQSSDIFTVQDKIKDFPFSGSNFSIRTFFESDGYTQSYIEEFYFVADQESVLGDESATAAVLVGEQPIEELDLDGMTLIITTDQGTTEIPSEDTLSIDEIIAAISDAYPEGIAKVGKDGANHVYLISETKGAEAYIQVSGGAAPWIFGTVKGAQGEDAKQEDTDWDDFYEDVKNGSGYPLIPFEITKEQLDLFIEEAANLYNKFRNDNVKSIRLSLTGNWRDGFNIPAIVGHHRNIVDVLFRPRFPMSIYDSVEDLESNIYINQIFNTAYSGSFPAQGFQSDYYISLCYLQDTSMILGLEPKWEIIDRKLRITPCLPAYSKVCILYKGVMTPDEMKQDHYFLQYVIGKCMQLQGLIRGQYGGTLSAGETTLQMNGSEMMAVGDKKVEDALAHFKGEQEPLSFFLG